jgi:ribosomal protein S18 acetylase RimI-like enzyme
MEAKQTPAHIRAFGPDDHAALAALFAEMQMHYGVPCPPAPSILEGLAGLPAGVEIFVAEIETIVGFAAVATLYPGPGLKPGLFLKELFVRAEFRGRGVGKALMRALVHIAVSRGLSRIDWTADSANPKLLAFYESLGGEPQTRKVFFRLTLPVLDALAGKEHPE